MPDGDNYKASKGISIGIYLKFYDKNGLKLLIPKSYQMFYVLKN